MLFVATNMHPASKCLLETPEGKAIIKKLFSDENVKEPGLKIVGAYVSCPKGKTAEHKGFFMVEAENAATVTKFFGSMTVDTRPVLPFSEVATSCDTIE